MLKHFSWYSYILQSQPAAAAGNGAAASSGHGARRSFAARLLEWACKGKGRACAQMHRAGGRLRVRARGCFAQRCGARESPRPCAKPCYFAPLRPCAEPCNRAPNIATWHQGHHRIVKPKRRLRAQAENGFVKPLSWSCACLIEDPQGACETPWIPEFTGHAVAPVVWLWDRLLQHPSR